jgi:hypothetical protein
MLLKINPWIVECHEFNYDGEPTIENIQLNINKSIKSYIVVVEDENGNDVPIKYMTLYVCDNILKQISGHITKYLMYRDYNIDTNKNYYYYECKNNEHINFNRFSNVYCNMSFYKILPKGNYKLKIYYECFYI